MTIQRHESKQVRGSQLVVEEDDVSDGGGIVVIRTGHLLRGGVASLCRPGKYTIREFFSRPHTFVELQLCFKV